MVLCVFTYFPSCAHGIYSTVIAVLVGFDGLHVGPSNLREFVFYHIPEGPNNIQLAS